MVIAGGGWEFELAAKYRDEIKGLREWPDMEGD